MEWSEELKKAAKNLTYFSVFCAAVGYLKIDPSSAFFGVKIENFNQTFVYVCLLFAAVYWLLILALRMWEEWIKISNEHQSLNELFEENRQCSRNIERDASFIANKVNIENLLSLLKQYDVYEERIGPEIQNSGGQVKINYRLQQQALYNFVNEATIASERISSELGDAVELLKRNRRVLMARKSTMIRMGVMEAGVPVIIFLVALSAAVLGNH